MMNAFEREFTNLLHRQIRDATDSRRQMLIKDLSGTKRMLEVTVWPVRKTLDGIVLELELVGRSGVRIYVDAADQNARLAMESEGYVVHAQNITRDRFCFEKMRVRTIASNGYFYIPFPRDDLDNKPEECRQSYAELYGKHGLAGIDSFEELNLFEREVTRYAKTLQRPLRPADVRFCLSCSPEFGRKVLISLREKRIIAPAGEGNRRIRQYTLEDRAYLYHL